MAHTASSGSTSTDGFGSPIICSLLSIRISTGGASFFLNVEGRAATTLAQSVRFNVLLTESLSTLSHLKDKTSNKYVEMQEKNVEALACGFLVVSSMKSKSKSSDTGRKIVMIIFTMASNAKNSNIRPDFV